MRALLGDWLNPRRPAGPAIVVDPAERRAIKLELVIVFTVTLGLSGLRSMLSFVDALLQPEALSKQQVALHRPQAELDLLDLAKQVISAVGLVGWAALGLYLLWRAGLTPARIGLGKRVRGKDVGLGFGLAALIGIPGLVLYFVGWKLNLNLAVLPSILDDTWWRPITLTLSAVGNSFAEEVLVVAYLLTRLRQLGLSENAALLVSAVLRGTYHFYQGFGGFVGNVVMGLIFGRVWQRTNRLWPLVIAHALLDVVAFVGYSVLRDHVSWLP